MPPPINTALVIRLRYAIRVLARITAIAFVIIFITWAVWHTSHARQRAAVHARAATTNPFGPEPPNVRSTYNRAWLEGFVEAWINGWMAGFYFLGGAIALWLLQNRLPRLILPLPAGNPCPTCAYDLGKAPPARCPECGSATGAKAMATPPE